MTMSNVMKSPSPLKTQDYDFDLPPQLIAQRPSLQRGQSRCLFMNGKGQTQIHSFADVLQYFKGDEILVLNDTRVIPARLKGHKSTGGRIEIFFLELLENDYIEHIEHIDQQADNAIYFKTIYFKAMTRGKLKPQQSVYLSAGACATLIKRDTHGHATMSLTWNFESLKSALEIDVTEYNLQDLFWEWLHHIGEIPLPPYIQRDADQDDTDRYQTVYANQPGAVAAPTAGLHFTQELLEVLQDKGVQIVYITLHVGAGTFLPVKADNLTDHVMHSERYHVPAKTQSYLNSERPIIAVGTTVVRALESFAQDPHANRTEIFIYPGYEFKIIDGLLSNFHLPQSTLLMLVSALAGHQTTMQAYRHAVQAQMRFYSYGDASLWVKPQGRWDR
jgi:S-adenosylmethionine:tRNA ribosyltransferase-isomerase